MRYKQTISMTYDQMIKMDPIDLIEILEKEVDLELPVSIDTPQEMRAAIETLMKASAYSSFFKELEAKTKITKREKKRAKCSPEEADRLLGIEEVFASFKKISEDHYEYVSKLMTMKRLMMDEIKMSGNVT